MKKEKEYLEIDIYRIFSALWHKIWIIILAAILLGSIICSISLFAIKPLYTAETLFYVNNKSLSVGDTKVSISQGDLTAAQSLIDTYSVILKSRNTLNEVIKQSGVSYSYKELNKMITSESVNGTEIFHVEVESPDPQEAELLANTIARVLPEKIAAIVDGSSVRIVDYAVVPSQKSSPNITLNTILGALAGAVLACIFIIARELKDDEIHDTDYIMQNYDEPILAVIPDLKSKGGSGRYGNGYYAESAYETANRKQKLKKKKKLSKSDSKIPEDPVKDIEVLGPNLNFAAAEAYKLLRTNLEFCVSQDSNCQIIGVTSAMRGEGKTTMSINTAYTFAQTGKRVLLIEADLRLPNIARRLDLEQRPGLSNLLSSKHITQGFLQKSDMIDNLWVIVGGDCPPNPAELIASKKMEQLVKELKCHFDVIIMDLPPVGVVTDALTAAKYLDGLAVISREKMCTRKGLAEVVRKLNFVGAKILGFVVTGSSVAKKSYKYKKSSYGNYYKESYEKAEK